MLYTIPVVSWLLFSFVDVADALVEAGTFRNRAHGIGGTVYLKDQSTLIIKGFTYDGAGPDAFFWAGTSGAPSGVGTILPYPFEGKFYDYEDLSAPILTGRFSGNNDIELKLPSGMKTTDLKWLSVWCRRFHVNFGDMFFPDGLEVEASITTEKTSELPPPLIEPISNAHDPNRFDDDWKVDSDAEAEGIYGSGAATQTASILAILLASLFV